MSLTLLSAASCEEMEEICSQDEKLLGRVMCSDLHPDLKTRGTLLFHLGSMAGECINIF